MGGAGAEARGRLSPLPTSLLLHMPVIFLQAAHFKSSEVVLVHEAFHGGGEGCDGGGDRNAADHSLGAHLDFINHGFGAGLDAFVVEHGGGAAGSEGSASIEFPLKFVVE